MSPPTNSPPRPEETLTTTRTDPDADKLAPSDSLWSVRPDHAVKLRTSPGARDEKTLTVMTAFRETLDRVPNRVALATKVEGSWRTWTYQEYYNDVMQAAKSFIKIGLEPYHGVGVIGFNSPEWMISDLAAIFAGGLATGIYTTNSPEACWFVADSAKCNVVVVENDQQLQKFLKVRNRLPHLKAIVQYKGQPKEKYDNVYSWSEFMKFGDDATTDALEERMSQQSPNKCCTLIYTSGTTGNPKGVMLSHDNMIWTSKMSCRRVEVKIDCEILVSYLPLSHVAAQVLDIYIPLVIGITVYFAQPDALKGSLGETLKEVQPTVFLGVPRVWEKMQEKMMSVSSRSGLVKRGIVNWARYVGLNGNLSTMMGGSMPFGWGLANRLIFKKVRAALGFDRCWLCLTAAAPIMKDTLDFFMSFNIPLMEIYGMSESSGPHTVSTPSKYRPMGTGLALEGCKVVIINKEKDGTGEVCMDGRNVFMGYLDEEAKTMEALDKSGLLRSGDFGKLDKDGYLFITGRLKELIITAGGENVAPTVIEDAVKEVLPCISNCMLVGDGKKFLSLLITLKTDVDTVTDVPTNRLSASCREWCRQVGSHLCLTVGDIIDNKDAKVYAAIQDGIDKANTKSVSRAQLIRKWTLLPNDFSIAGGELGPTMKLRRPIVSKMYKPHIDSFYLETEAE